MSIEAKKCAHETCKCVVGDGKKYCSVFCEDAKGVTTLKCDCPHPECSARAI